MLCTVISIKKGLVTNKFMDTLIWKSYPKVFFSYFGGSIYCSYEFSFNIGLFYLIN